MNYESMLDHIVQFIFLGCLILFIVLSAIYICWDDYKKAKRTALRKAEKNYERLTMEYFESRLKRAVKQGGVK